MKKLLVALVATAFVAFVSTTVRAAEEVVLKGKALCAKCELHESPKCQTVIKTEDGTLYYTKENDVAKEFHKNICQAPAKVVAKGTVKEKDGKKYITLTKIDVE
ncbi:MAG TPA: DUF6370 family protein [Verrucomicrobiae bacterium]|jgi:hypothetical protein